jgi:hypothetical protein
MITFACKCGAQYTVQDDYAGKKTSCRNCQTRMIIPAPAYSPPSALPITPPPPPAIPLSVGASDAISSRRDIGYEERLQSLTWLGWLVWCVLPPIWVLVSAFVSSFGSRSNPQQPVHDFNFPQPTPTASLSALVGGGGFLLLMLLFLYGVWCACGVVCGIGVERIITHCLARDGGIFGRKRRV